MKKILAAIAMSVSMALATPAMSATMATGSPDGFYHNGLYNTLNSNVQRASRGDMELDYYNEDGTDGTVYNLEAVQAGDADIAAAQLGGTVIESYPNVKVIGKFGYEAAHMVVPVKSKIKSCSILEKKTNYRIGINSMGGSPVTMSVMRKVDKDYKRSEGNMVDVLDEVEAEMSMSDGTIDAYFFISTPGKGTAKYFQNSQFKYVDCWDGDFNDLEANNQPLYEKIKLGKKQGYLKKFKTFSVPGVIVANKNFLKEEGRKTTRTLLKATKATYSGIKAQNKFDFYPED